MSNQKKFYINGAWVDPVVARDLDVINPSTEEVCATISLGDQADTDAAVAAAKAALPAWSATTREQRLDYLQKLLAAYQARADDMAVAISTEMGAPMKVASTAQVGAGMAHIANTIEALKTFTFEEPLDEVNSNYGIIHEPIGVTALITPWNWPMNQVTLKVAPAVAAGCTMVLKPSEIAPLSSIVFAEMMEEAGFPAGVFNMVHGDGPGVGTQLSGHPDVDMVSFTGSTRAGTAISKNAADSVKRVALELGGKGANIVFADADDKAVMRGAGGCFYNSGQSCNAPTRMMVEASAYEAAVATAAEVANNTPVDDASKDGPHIGPVVSEAQYNKIQAMIEQGIAEGARLVAGGPGRAEGHDKGYFVKPTVFADVTQDMSIAKQEIFGPVLSILKFDSEEQAVAMANDTVYGLTNYIQTQDEVRAQRVARQLKSGMVEINGLACTAVPAPFGGYKQSGNSREGGRWGLEEFLETKVVGGWQAQA
ncbi:MAG: aldehyde dehydrogenase family protein [Gammaproteobacteria bacterium]|nr:aldehyde dehydrogenase family protein [Gammaproteobacteria bacterium]